MKTLVVTICCLNLFLSFQNLQSQIATNVVVSEFATRGAGSAYDEFVELYNPTANDIDISNWKMQYKSANGSTWNDYATIPSNNIIKAHGYFLLSNNSFTGTVISDIKWGSNGIADSGHVRIINDTGLEIDKVGYGKVIDPKGNPAPKAVTPGNTSTYNNSVERKAAASSTAVSLAAGGAEEKAGNGYNSKNNANDFVVQTNGRNPQNSTSPIEPKSADGAGSAYCIQSRVKASSTVDLVFVFKPSPTDPVSALKIVIPTGMTWAQSEWNVVYDPNMTATVTFTNDSIFFLPVSIAGDSVRITIKQITTASQTGSFTFRFFTRGLSRLIEIQTSPSVLVVGAPISIFEARENEVNGVSKKLGQYVTVNGIVTVANEFGEPSYIQDGSAGIAVFDYNFSQSVSVGDEVSITGRVDQFNGLTELAQIFIEAKPSAGNVVTPVVVRIPDILYDGTNGIEQYESELIRIVGVSVNTNVWDVTGSGTNYKINVGSDMMDLRVDNNVDFVGQPAPGGIFEVVGVLSQFKSSSPYIGAYQLMPRRKSDIITGGPRILTFPVETNIQARSVTLKWTTQNASSSFARFGKTKNYELGVAGVRDSVFAHIVNFMSLDPATMYHTQAYSVAKGDTSFSQDLIFSTASLTSTGAMNVYFNKSVDNKLAVGELAQGNVNFASKLLDRISSAKYSIDVCLYSMSGNVGSDIATALVDAKSRGVAVRMIAENDNSNTAPMNKMKTSAPFITDAYDAVNAGAGLMHNKFFIIDARNRTSDIDDWVITGSWNPTDGGTNNDAQNFVEIQDQALANAYTVEFEEMWGSSDDTPNKSASRFGARKFDNTPHRFNIKGISCELYFSPGDHTTNKIIEALSPATSSINFALLTFTRSDVANVLKSKYDATVKVRGVMDNNGDTGTQFGFLQSNGIDVHLKASSLSGLLHHKYAIIDPEKFDENTAVITGSHNWSTSAETSNNENTLIIHDARLANLYLQEFGKRYTEAGGTDKIVTGVQRDDQKIPDEFYIGQNYPNPFTSQTTITLTPSLSQRERVSELQVRVSFKVYDVLGREVLDLTNKIHDMDSEIINLQIDANQLPHSGIYFCRLVTQRTLYIIKMNYVR